MLSLNQSANTHTIRKQAGYCHLLRVDSCDTFSFKALRLRRSLSDTNAGKAEQQQYTGVKV